MSIYSLGKIPRPLYYLVPIAFSCWFSVYYVKILRLNPCQDSVPVDLAKALNSLKDNSDIHSLEKVVGSGCLVKTQNTNKKYYFWSNNQQTLVVAIDPSTQKIIKKQITPAKK